MILGFDTFLKLGVGLRNPLSTMAKNDPKHKSVNYRLCYPTNAGKFDPSFQLQAALEAVKATSKKPWKRNIGTSGSSSLLLKMLVKKNGCICGTLAICEADKKIQLVDTEANGETWEEVIDPVDKAGKKRNVQDRALYFSVRKNHVAVIRTKELNIDDLQIFLGWLIRDHAKLHTTTHFALINQPSKAALDKLKNRNIKSIEFGKDAYQVIKHPIVSSDDKRQKYKKVITPDPLFMDLLKQFGGNEEVIGELSNSKDPGGIYVSIEINYKGRKRKDAQDVMRAIATTVGDNQEFTPVIHLAGAGKIEGDELTIKDSVKVQCPDGLISQDDAMTQITNWLLNQFTDGNIVL